MPNKGAAGNSHYAFSFMIVDLHFHPFCLAQAQSAVVAAVPELTSEVIRQRFFWDFSLGF
jgi:hypothetical protein